MATADVAAGRFGGKTVEDVYQKKTQLEHILLRPDTYIGSIERTTALLWVVDDDKMVQRNVSYVPGLYKIFDEILVNASDNKQRDAKMDTIKVEIDRENNRISVYNNGQGIPIEMHATEKVYVPELIFGHLLTSSNYDDNQKKVTGGRNGYGAKLCNIFSTEFIVETADKVAGKKFKQVFTNNMSNKSQPEITAFNKEDFTKITFKPDLKKFGMDFIDDDLEALLRKRVYDIAGCVAGIKVFLNDERIKVKNFKNFVEMFLGEPPEAPLVHEQAGARWEVCFSVSEGQFQQMSFVNGIWTMKGGTHVEHVAGQIVAKLAELIKKKNKSIDIKPFQIRNHLSLYVNCLVENPAFDSQTKENMILKQSSFGSKCELSEDFMKKVSKSGVVEAILNWAKFKESQQLKKTDGAKKVRVSGIPKLDDANMAGSRQADKCYLILTEGDSAKTLAVSGLSVVGRDYYGVFPLRGKLLNVREASPKQVMENVEINFIKQILGLQHGKVYEDTKSLRYGHILIMTDQDHDGSHIKGLIINFLDHFWPSLLRVPNFLMEFITPIVKVTKGKQKISFFTLPEYEAWKEANSGGKGWTVKYYKGLGTSTSNEAKEYFSNLKLHQKPFGVVDTSDRELLDMAFSKKKADDRKDWLRNFQPGTYMDHNVSEIKMNDFVNRELILFSLADNVRSIPSVMDGWKPGQRKVLFCAFKKNLVGEIKVAQFSGYISEHSAYHHGEQSLATTIVGMAQDFVGSNNMNFLLPCGSFGSRLQGGKDAASPRYIHTSLSPLARLVFPAPDDQLLRYLDDDGQSIEPEWYAPIIPTVLVNGSDGIGTGWASSIPNYNPMDLVDNIRLLMKGEPLKKMHPWYRGFTGGIEMIAEDKYKISGRMRKVDETTLEITELPVGMWTQTYKEMLEGYMTGNDKQPAIIKDFKEYHTDTTVHFVVNLTEENMAKCEQEGLEKKFKISTTLSTSNMVCFDPQGKIKKYANAEEILSEFYGVRVDFYQRRKAWLLDHLRNEYNRLDNKVRFILAVIKGEIVVQNRKRDQILADLEKAGFTPFLKNQAMANSNNNNNENNEEEKEEGKIPAHRGYDYLLSMPIWSLTKEKVDQLTEEAKVKLQELESLMAKSHIDLWNDDLNRFVAEWMKMVVNEKWSSGTVSISLDKAEIDAEGDAMDTQPAATKKPAAKPRGRKAVGAVAPASVPASLKDTSATSPSLPAMDIDDDDAFENDMQAEPAVSPAIAAASNTAAAATATAVTAAAGKKPAAKPRVRKVASAPAASAAASTSSSADVAIDANAAKKPAAKPRVRKVASANAAVGASGVPSSPKTSLVPSSPAAAKSPAAKRARTVAASPLRESVVGTSVDSLSNRLSAIKISRGGAADTFLGSSLSKVPSPNFHLGVSSSSDSAAAKTTKRATSSTSATAATAATAKKTTAGASTGKKTTVPSATGRITTGAAASKQTKQTKASAGVTAASSVADLTPADADEMEVEQPVAVDNKPAEATSAAASRPTRARKAIVYKIDDSDSEEEDFVPINRRKKVMESDDEYNGPSDDDD